MNRNIIISLLFAAVAIVASPPCLAIEVRTYQFSGDNRPYRYQAWGPAIDAQLSGTFDLVLDQSAGTAQLTNIQTTIVNPAYAPPNASVPLSASSRTFFENLPFSSRWPTNLTSLTGHFLAPDLLEFDGPNSGVSLKHDANSNLPYLGYSFPISHYIYGHDTALQLKLQGDTAAITAVAFHIIAIDSPIYYLLDAQATLVPEPSAVVLLTVDAISMLTYRCCKSVPHNRV
jgi:hypothetical protein